MPKIVNKSEQIANMVKQLSGIGIPHDMICSIADISKPTLYKYYREELDKGKASAVAKVAANLFDMATGNGNRALPAAIFFLKTQGGFRETDRIEIADVSEESDKFRKLLSNIRESKLSEKDSNESTH